MNKLRFFICEKFLNNKMGRSIFVPIYKLYSFLICRLVEWRFPSLRAWPRNSLVSNDIVPGISDIDITLYNLNHSFYCNEFFLKEYLAGLKVLFPMMGECNFYDKNDLVIVESICNPLEIGRDPQLLARHPGIQKVVTSRDCLIYLLRQWRSDRHYLQTIPKLRILKWRRIFKRLELENLYKEPEDIQKMITKLSNRCFDQELKKIIFYPHEWIGHYYKNFDEELEKVELDKISQDEKMIMIGQIKWEICGILSQLPFLENARDMTYHFRHLASLLKKLDVENVTALIGLIESLNMRILRRYSN